MIYVMLPERGARRLSFYLAMEEYVARHLNTGDDCFFMWQVEPSVIFGRNQIVEAEVNLAYCREHGIQMYRRKSGGGCVYADMSNIMLSYITRSEEVNLTFNRYINLVALTLCRLGLDARTSGRNDVLLAFDADDGSQGKQLLKVSGNAFYHLTGHSIVHGTLLYDTCMANMLGAITPSDAKLQGKGVKSVRQHIGLLKDYISLSLDELMTFIRQSLCTDELLLTDADVAAIEELEQEYLRPEFIFGQNPAYTTTRRRRIEGVGELEVRMEVKGNVIRRVNIVGDYFLTGDLDGLLLKPLCGVTLDERSIAAALPERLDHIIMNLRKDDFIQLITNQFSQ